MKIHTTLTLPPELALAMDYRRLVLGVPHARSIITALDSAYGSPLTKFQKIDLAAARRKAAKEAK